MINQQNIFAQTTHCTCGRCFCSTPKMTTLDGKAICPNCKQAYDTKILQQRANAIPPQPNQNNQ